MPASSASRSMRRLAPVVLGAALASLSGAQALAQSDKPVLTVYTYDSFTPDWGPGPQIEKMFEAVCDCDLRLVGLEDGVAILNRLKLEGASTDADVALGLTTDLIPEAKATGLFVDSQVDQSGLSVPTGFSDPVFVPYDYSYLAFVYDTQTIKTPPKSLDDLVNGDPQVKIALEDPRTSTPGLGFLLWMKAIYGDQAAEKWRKLSDRILTVTPGWSEAYGLFTNGEVPMVLSYTTSPAYHEIEEKTDRYQAASFKDGQYLQIEVGAVLKSADKPQLARDFLAFMITPKVQEILPTTNWTLPVRSDIALPPEFDAAAKVETPITIDPETVAKNRKAWTQEWLEALGRR